MLRVFRIPEPKCPSTTLPCRLQACSQNAEPVQTIPSSRPEPTFQINSPISPRLSKPVSSSIWIYCWPLQKPQQRGQQLQQQAPKRVCRKFYLAHTRTRRLPTRRQFLCTAASPLQQTLWTQQECTVLPHRWASHRSLANKKQSYCLLFVSSHKFLSACFNSDFGKKNGGWHINFSQAAAINQRYEQTRKHYAKTTHTSLLILPWKEKGYGQGFFLPYWPPETALPLISQPWKGAAWSSTVEDFSPTRSLWSQCLTLSALHCKDVHTLLFSCQQPCHKNF